MNNEEKYNYLISCIKKNDENAYKELYHLLYAPLCIFALRYISDREEAKDCVQEVFYKIWRDRNDLLINTSIKSYLLTATRNICLNILQKKKSESTYEQYIFNTYDEFKEEDLYSITELQDLIEKAVDKLPKKLRTVFQMSRFNHMTYREIAVKQNISIKTVESYIHKSLILLSSELKDYVVAIIIIHYFYKILNFL